MPETEHTDFYVNFVSDLNPGGKKLGTFAALAKSNGVRKATWPQYDLATKPVLQLKRDNITVIRDGKSQNCITLCPPGACFR